MRPIKKGATDQSIVIRIIDSTAGTPEEAVEHDTSGIALWYRREAATKTAITPAALAALDTAHSDGGIEHIDDGYYRLDLPDAALATGVNGVMVGGTVTGMIVIGCYIHLTDYDPQDAVRMGLTALPNAAADAAGGLPISDAGALDLDAKLANTNEVTAARMGALTDWIDGGRLDLIADAILEDTGTTLDTLVKDIPTTAEFELRTIAAADYTIVTDLGVVQTGDSFAIVNGDHGLVSIQDDVDAILADTNELQTDDTPGAIAALENLSAADVNAEVVDVLKTDTIAEMAQGAPSATPTFESAINYLYRRFRNKTETTATLCSLYNDAGNAVLCKSVLGDDGTTFTMAEWITGA